MASTVKSINTKAATVKGKGKAAGTVLGRPQKFQKNFREGKPQSDRPKPKVLDTNFPVYLIRSRLSLGMLDDSLRANGAEAGYMRVVYDNQGHETDRAIAILSEEGYEALVQAGFGEFKVRNGFSVQRFGLTEAHLPGDGRTSNLFVPAPRDSRFTEALARETIGNKLDLFKEWGIIPEGSWSLKIPLKSRETGEIRSGCYLVFNEGVDVNVMAVVRLLLHDTYWPELADEEERAVFRCFWARDRTKPRKEGEDDEASDEAAEGAAELSPEEQKRKALQAAVNGKPLGRSPKGKGKGAGPKKAKAAGAAAEPAPEPVKAVAPEQPELAE